MTRAPMAAISPCCWPAEGAHRRRHHPGSFVIGADQTLALGTELLHKPADRAAAAAQLDRLRGRTHRLHAP